MSTPPPEVLEAILAPVTQVVRHVDIYESDGTTPWMMDAPLVSGSVSIDQTRDERRTGEFSLVNDDGNLDTTPGKLWYDKVVKVYRGAIVNGEVWEAQIGMFMIDQFKEPRFPSIVGLTCRDFTKKLLKSKFAYPTLFEAGTPLEDVVSAIALNGGIDDVILPNTGLTLADEHLFDKGTERWEAIKELVLAHGYEAFMNPRGAMVMQAQRDPFLSPTIFTFETGPGGSLADWEKQSTDARIYNHIAVTGEGTNQAPVYAEVRNTAVTSPTRIDQLGERTYEFESSYITTVLQAEEVAANLLNIYALEQYDLSLTSAVIPWLEAGEIIEFVDPDPNPADPTRFLLSSLEIPLTLAPMSSTVKRVTFVG